MVASDCTLGNAANTSSLGPFGGREESWWLVGRKSKERTRCRRAARCGDGTSPPLSQDERRAPRRSVWQGSGTFPKVGKEIQAVPIRVRDVERG